MYEELKYGISFSVDSRVELIFGMLSKFKKEDKTKEEELDYIEVRATEYANNLYNSIDFNKYPKLKKWAIIISNISDCSSIPYINMFLNEDFTLKETIAKNQFLEKYKDPNWQLLINNIEEFISDIKDFRQKENYLKFYQSNFSEFHKMITQSTKWYPKDMDIKDIEKCYGKKLTKYPVVYSIFFNGGFGPIIDGIPTCFKGLDIENGEYRESASYIVNLFHEYSHPFINPLVDKYWNKLENISEFITYSIQNGLPLTYQGNPQTLYYEYYVRTMAHILSSPYEDNSRFIEIFNKMGFVKLSEMVEFTEKNFKLGDNFEEFLVNKLIPFTNNITRNLDVKEK